MSNFVENTSFALKTKTSGDQYCQTIKLISGGERVKKVKRRGKRGGKSILQFNRK